MPLGQSRGVGSLGQQGSGLLWVSRGVGSLESEQGSGLPWVRAGEWAVLEPSLGLALSRSSLH